VGLKQEVYGVYSRQDPAASIEPAWD